MPLAAVLAGCVIPDIPWILNRLVPADGLFDDPIVQLAYLNIQASLAFSALLAFALGAFFLRWQIAGVVATLGCAIHLLLDSLQDKWGNGVHLIAPLDWSTFAIRILPIESTATWIVSALGLGVLLLVRRVHDDVRMLRITPGRGLAVLALTAAYFLAPCVFIDDLVAANHRYLDTLADVAGRTGKPIEFDREWLSVEAGTVTITGHNDEVFAVVDPPESLSAGKYSVRAEFVAPDRVRLLEWKAHTRSRDIASYLGLAIIAGWFLAMTGVWLRSGRTDALPHS